MATRCRCEVLLDLRGHSAAGQLFWGLVCIESLDPGKHIGGIQLTVKGLAGDVPAFLLRAARPEKGLAVRLDDLAECDHRGPVVYLGGAGRLSSGLLRRFSRIELTPAGLPQDIDSHFFWQRIATSEFSTRLLQAADTFLGQDGLESARQMLDSLRPYQPRVSLITSVFDGDRWLAHFLENMGQLEGYADCEHLLIRAGSPGQEHDALLAHSRRWPGAIYLNLEKDPGLYETWNLGCCLARGRYLSNANVDDRRHPEQVRRLASTLDAQPSADLASAALRITEVANQNWNDGSGGGAFFAEAAEGLYGGTDLARRAGGQLRPRNIPHCMPLWRRSLHGLRGFFNETEYGPSADWEYWLRCAAGGSRYYHTPEALGLYLKREDSFWRQDPSARRFDDRILDRYRPILAGQATGTPPHGLPWEELTRFMETGNWFGVLLCLVRLNALSDEAGRDPAGARKVASAYARRYFGLNEFQPVLTSWLYGGANAVLERLQPVLFDWLHAFMNGVEADAEGSARAGGCWCALLVDWHLQTGEVTPLIGLALLQRRLDGGPEAERELLRAIHARDPQGFWRGLQRVYRFAVPLEEVVSAVGALAVPPPATPLAEPVRLVYFPSYSNKYQELLYWSCQRAGMQVEPAADVAALQALAPRPDCANIVHLHWLNAVFRDPAVPFEQAAGRFVQVVRGLRERGFALYWTVHNRLNHDSQHPEAEARFRSALARLVDRVYLHHPLLRDELDWLPDNLTPWLCEHGPYIKPVRQGIGKRVARQRLGLTESARVFLWFGQLRPYKALDVRLPAILEALAADPDARLIVAGKVEAPEVQRMLAGAGEQAIFINRHVPNIELQHLADAADFGILTYRDILTSGAMFHIYCMGLPVIAPDRGSLPAYVVPGWNGFLYRDDQELAEAIERVCAMRADELAAFREAAARTARSFRWGRVTV